MKRTILITGASKGIGKYLLEKFAKDGYKTCGTYNRTTLDNKNESLYTKVDVTNQNQVRDWITESVDIDSEIVLINCAGITYNAFAHKSDLTKWQNVINVNLMGTFNAIRFVLPLMRERKNGRIINFSSVVAQKGVAGTSAYAASKAALWGLTKSIAVENANKNITMNNINLGYMNIGMIEQVPQEIQKIIKDSIPLKTFGGPDEILKTVMYLMDSPYITGTSIDLNGGLL